MKTFKTVTEFKKVLAKGDKLHTMFHLHFVGRDPETMQPIYTDEDRGVREVSIRQSNSFALKTTHPSGKVDDAWCSYPKASEAEVFDNTLVIYETNPRTNERYKVLTYKFV